MPENWLGQRGLSIDRAGSFGVGTSAHLVLRWFIRGGRVCAEHSVAWGHIYLSVLVWYLFWSFSGAFEQRIFGICGIDCRMGGFCCLVHLVWWNLEPHCLSGMGVLYPGASADCIWQLAVFTAEDSSGSADAVDSFWQQ